MSPPSVDPESRSEPPSNRHYGRHKARELALQVLFQLDFHGHTEFWLEQFWSQQTVSESIREFVNLLVTGVQNQHEELDQLIRRYAENWSLDRMPVIDRNILRLSIYELVWVPDVPAKVTMNEALELAKSFADADATRFINGILDKLLKQDVRLRPKRTAMTANGVRTI